MFSRPRVLFGCLTSGTLQNNFYKELQWTQIAGAAQYVVDQCSKRKSITPLKDSGRICADKTFVEGDIIVKGHADFDDGWYVVVRGDWC